MSDDDGIDWFAPGLFGPSDGTWTNARLEPTPLTYETLVRGSETALARPPDPELVHPAELHRRRFVALVCRTRRVYVAPDVNRDEVAAAFALLSIEVVVVPIAPAGAVFAIDDDGRRVHEGRT